MSEKLFYSMGEVSEMFDVKPSLLRHWESQFSVLRPKRNKKGNRLFTPQDVENLKLIYHLVRERGMTLEGADKAIRRMRAGAVGMERDVELMERLQRIRAMLLEVREELKGGEAEDDSEPREDADPFAAAVAAGDDSPQEEPCAGETPLARLRQKAVVRIIEQADAAPEREDADNAARKSPRRRPRRRKEDADDKELFAFYEQSLF